MDPWCAVDLQVGGRVLFGFALHHERLGGRSWMMSSLILVLDELRGRAWTSSGRLYDLRRQIALGDIPGEGEEAWAVYDLLLSLDAADALAVPAFPADPVFSARWVSACKVARHLGVVTPIRTVEAVAGFVRDHGLDPGR